VDGQEWADDDVPIRPPLPKDDRIWRHPSEMGQVSLEADLPSGRPTWAIAVGAGLLGAAVTAVTLITVVGLQRPSSKSQTRAVPAVSTGLSPATTAEVVVTPPPTTRKVSTTRPPSPTTGLPAVVVPTTVPPPPTTIPVVSRPWLVGLRTTAVDGSLATGLAVIVRADGYLLASAASIAGQTAIEVSLPGQGPVKAQVAGVDADTGTAVLHVDLQNLTVAPLGSALGLTADSAMAAIDHSGGHPVTLNRLICDGQNLDGSALKRQLCVKTTTEVGAAVMQNDQVVGLVTARDTDNDSMMAVPIDIAMASVDSIIRTGAVHRPWFGISWSSDLHLTKVDPQSPADEAGLTVDDVVIAVGNHQLESSGQLMMSVWSKVADTPVVMTIERNGERMDVQVTPRDAP